MRNEVFKFGGTSVQTAGAINHIKRIILANTRARVVVVSAVCGVTNLLVRFCKEPLGKRLRIIDEIESIHIRLAEDLLLSEDAILGIKSKIYNLRLNIHTDVGSPAKADQVLAVGEDLSSLMVYEFLRQHMQIALLDSKELIITDNTFGKAQPDLVAVKVMVRGKISQFPEEYVILTQGFVGATEDGQATTLGRGGSDYSAALIAEALNAEKLHIYSNVSGVYTMDPNIVQNARLIPYINFKEMLEMANFGAKILHPASLEPCRRANIPIVISSTFDDECKHTYVSVMDEGDQVGVPQIRALTMRSSQLLVSITNLKTSNNYGFLANIFGIFAKYKIDLDIITTSESNMVIAVDIANLGSLGLNPFDNPELMGELRVGAKVTVETGLTLIVVIGSGLTVPGVVQSMLSKLDESFVRLICYGASSSSVGVMVRDRDANKVVNILHGGLLEAD